MKNSSKILLSVLLADVVLPVRVFAVDPAGSAQEKYRLGQYTQAAAGFSEALAREPKNQLYHYLFANCLVHLKQHDRAADEYRAAYQLDPASRTGEYCRQALMAYRKRFPESVAGGRPAGGAGEVDKVKSQIRKQIDFEKDKQDSVASRNERLIRLHVEDELRRIDEWMEAEIQKLNDPLIYTPGPRANPLLANPELLKQKEDQVRASAREQKEAVLRAASERSQHNESWVKEREALLDETAGNLQSQLDQPAGRSGVKLQAKGTGLYVRYYGKPGGANQYPDPHQATVRIKEAGATDENGRTNLATSPDKQAPSSPERDVKGRVIKNTKPVQVENSAVPL